MAAGMSINLDSSYTSDPGWVSLTLRPYGQAAQLKMSSSKSALTTASISTVTDHHVETMSHCNAPDDIWQIVRRASMHDMGVESLVWGHIGLEIWGKPTPVRFSVGAKCPGRAPIHSDPRLPLSDLCNLRR